MYYEFPFAVYAYNSLNYPLPVGARLAPHDLGNPQDLFNPVGIGPYSCDPLFNFDAYRNASPQILYWKDLHSKFIQQSWRYYYLYKDKAFLDYVWPACKAVYEFMKTTDTTSDLPPLLKDYIPDNQGSDNTYDAWGLHGTSALCGGLWDGAPEAMEQMAILENDPILTDVLTWLYGPNGTDGAKANLDAILWYEYTPGKGYYKIDTKSSSPTSIMADALNGQRYGEITGLPDILPASRMASHLNEVYQRCVVPLSDYVGEFGVGAPDGIGDVGAINGRKEDGSPIGSIEQGEEVWGGSTYFLAALMYRSGLTEQALLTAYGAYYPVYENETTAYWFNTPEAWHEDGKTPRPKGPEQYMRARAVWELMFEIKDPYLEKKTAVVSSSASSDLTAYKAIDGNLVTRWASNPSDPQWIYIDFTKQRSFDKVTLYWHTNYATQYQIQISDDGINWTLIYTQTAGDGGVDTINVGVKAARYVRMYGIQSSAGAGYSLYEFEVSSPLDTTVDYFSYYYLDTNGIPVYFIGNTMNYEVHIRNLEAQNLNNLTIQVIQEYNESGPGFNKGDPLPGDSTQTWTNQAVLQGAELVLSDSYYISYDVQPGLDQTHVIVSQGGVELYNNSEAGIWCPPLPQGVISGVVNIQGRTNHAELITFELRNAGETTAVKISQIVTASDGSYKFDYLSSGNYDLAIKSANTLRAKQDNISVVDAQTTPNINFTLLGGDADNNNVVNVFDNSILNGAFGSTEGSPNWDARADFDNNKVVNVFDNSILNGNFAKSGAQ